MTIFWVNLPFASCLDELMNNSSLTESFGSCSLLLGEYVE